MIEHQQDRDAMVDSFTAFVNEMPGDKVIQHCRPGPYDPDATRESAWHFCAVGEFARSVNEHEYTIAQLLEDEIPAVFEWLNESMPATYGELNEVIEDGLELADELKRIDDEQDAKDRAEEEAYLYDISKGGQ